MSHTPSATARAAGLSLAPIALTIAAGLTPHTLHAATAQHVHEDPTQDTHRLVVKFHDHLGARADNGVVEFQEAHNVLPIHAQAFAANHNAIYTQLIQLPDNTLDAIEARSASPNPIDLGSMIEVHVEGISLQQAAEILQESDNIEWVSIERLLNPPPCTDLKPTTIDFNGLVGYRAPHIGINLSPLQAQGKATGAGVRFANIEYFFNPEHEDLCGIDTPWSGTIPQFVFDNGWDNHGTAAIGILNAQNNGYGITGLVPDATGAFFPEYTEENGSQRAAAITQAAAYLDFGDVLMLEMQTSNFSGGYGPAELDLSVWTATRAAVDAGIIVVAAAGNGNRDLDSSLFSTYQSRGDSGAILVGAGSPDVFRDKLPFSTYGSMVSLQGWGLDVATLGYGTLLELDHNQNYTASFNGTSSATPIVAGAVAAVQSYALDTHGIRIGPDDMRELLVISGDPQGQGGNIGPRPNVGSAVKLIDTLIPCLLDLDGSGVVDLADLLIALNGFGIGRDIVFGGDDPNPDFDGSGTTDLNDLLNILSNFGKRCPSLIATDVPADPAG